MFASIGLVNASSVNQPANLYPFSILVGPFAKPKSAKDCAPTVEYVFNSTPLIIIFICVPTVIDIFSLVTVLSVPPLISTKDIVAV